MPAPASDFSALLLDWLAATWSEAIRERPTLNIWQWNALHNYIDEKQAANPGYYNPELTPYTKFFQEAVTSHFGDIHPDDWWLRELVARGQRVDEAFVVKSSQSGFTQAGLNALLYLPHFAPGRILYTLDSREKAKQVARIRLIPSLEKTAGAVMTADKDDVGLHLIELLNMVIELAGSYAAGIFSEKWLRYGFLDDVEYMVAEGGMPGMLDGVHVIDHIRSRFTTADNSFLGVFSKPNLEESEFIANFKGGSQHGFYVPCPNCNDRQILELEGLYYRHPGCKDLAGRHDLEAVEQLTTYQCAHCSHQIEEKWKREMNAAGIWLPKDRAQRIRDEDPALVPRRLSMRINDLNSPFPKVRWGILARMNIEAQHNPAKLKYLVTNHGARPWRESAINLRADQIRALCAGARDPRTRKFYDADDAGNPRVPEYRRGECPFIPALVTATSDRQADKKKWIVCAWKIDGTCALIDYGATLADDDLLALQWDPRAHHGAPFVCLANPDQPLAAEWGLIDSGFETFDVYNFCIRSGWKWYPSKGVGGLSAGGRLVEGKEDFYEGNPILRYHYHDHHLKVHFYKNKIEKRGYPRLYLPVDVGDDLVGEWTAESLAPKILSSGYKIMEWHHDKKKGANDWGDAGKMQYVIWQILGPGLQAAAQAAAAAAPPPDPPKPVERIAL